jgi:type I restriction enzyme S subunit
MRTKTSQLKRSEYKSEPAQQQEFSENQPARHSRAGGNPLPEGWVATELGKVVDYGRTQKVELKDVDHSTWVLELEDIEKGTSKLLQRLNASERAFKSTKNKFESGDVLYGKLRPYLNKVIIADDGGVCTTEIIPLNAEPTVSNRYLFHWLKGKDFLDYVNEVSYGVNMPRLGTKDGVAAPLVLPPLAEQKVIAEKLDTLLAQVDTTKARLERIPDIIKRFRQSVLAAAVSGKLTGDDTEKFEKVEVERIAKNEKYSLGIGPFGSNLKVSDYMGIGHPLVFVREIRSRTFGDDSTKFVSSEKFTELKAHRVKPGDILITKMGGPPGDIAIYPDHRPEAVITADCIKLSVDESRFSRDYIAYAMESQDFRQSVISISAGVAQQKVNLKKFRLLSLSIPPIKEQTEIVRRVEELFAFADTIEQKAAAALERVNSLTQSILAKAFRGELTVDWRTANPELISGDNSAEALLVKIQAEREALKPVKKTRKKKAKA